MFEDEYKDGELNHRKYRCRVCDGPMELSIQLVCDECDRRDSEEMKSEQELYSGLLGIEKPVYRKLAKETPAVSIGEAKENPGTKRKSYQM